MRLGLAIAAVIAGCLASALLLAMHPELLAHRLVLSAAAVLLALLFLLLGAAARDAWHAHHGADEAIRTLQPLLLAAPIAFLVWNAARGVRLWSAAAERMFGLDRAAALGRPLPASLHGLRDAVNQALSQQPAVVGLPVNVYSDSGDLLHLMVSASRLLDADPDGPTIAAMIEDATPHRLQEARRLDAVRAQRDALVREVHHRIKNHLQGVAGLLRQHLGDKPLLQPLLQAATSQVLTIAAVHGLQGELQAPALGLRDLVLRVAGSVSDIMHVPIAIGDGSAALRELRIGEEEAVPLAMVLNELLMNAVKHRSRREGDARVELEAERGRDWARIRVSNPGFLPPRFNFELGAQLGTGLSLVKSLLPLQGVALRITEQGGRVVAALEIAPPHLLVANDPGEDLGVTEAA